MQTGLTLNEATSLIDKFKQPNAALLANVSVFSKETRVEKHLPKYDLTQEYFPDGPLQSAFSAKVYVPGYSQYHQYQGVKGEIVLELKEVNAVSIWGSTTSLIDKGKIWGGFMSAAAVNDTQQDIQVVGTEIDVINNAKDGASPNQKLGYRLYQSVVKTTLLQ